MKKRIKPWPTIMICVLSAIVIMCVSFVTFEIISERREVQVKTGYCSDEKILSLLSNDDTSPEFVLMGDYYQLPCRLSDFLDNGWEVTDAGEFFQPLETVIPSLKYVNYMLEKEQFYCLVDVANLNDFPTEINNGMVVSMYIDVVSSLPEDKEDFLVTKNGIRLFTRKELIEAALSSNPFYAVVTEQKGFAISQYQCIIVNKEAIMKIRLSSVKNGANIFYFSCSEYSNIEPVLPLE